MNKYRVADTVLTILVVVIAIAAVAAAVVFTVHWVASHEEPENRTYENVRIYEQELVAMSETINSDRTIAVYFNALQPFSGVDIVCTASENCSLNVAVYNFDTDYRTTVSGKKINSASYSNYKNTSKLALGLGTLPAGEYLVVLSSKTNAVISCAYYQSETAGNSVVVYENEGLLLNCVPYMSVIFDAPSPDGSYFG